MAKYSFELKLEAVLAYLEGKESIREVAKRFNVSKTPLSTWIAHYRENGEQGLISSYTNYDIQFKMNVLNYMRAILERLWYKLRLYLVFLHLPRFINGRGRLKDLVWTLYYQRKRGVHP